MLDDLNNKMSASFNSLLRDFSSLRTGKVSASLLDGVCVNAYGAVSLLSQVASINVLDSRTLVMQIWDENLVKSVELAIRNSHLGLNPIVDGQTIRIIVPELSEERRLELCKSAAKFAEQCRIAIRNIRREGMDLVKKVERKKDISEDECRRLCTDIQRMTDDFINKVDLSLKSKEREIMKI